MLVAGGCALVELTTPEVWTWQQQWREVFARELHAATGKWVLRQYDWHVFSFGHHRHVAGNRARDTYRAIAPCSFLVLGADGRYTFGFRCDGKPPEWSVSGIDIVVAPPSMEWTMAFTHEGQCGPYFAVP